MPQDRPDRQFFDHLPSAHAILLIITFYARGNSGSIQTSHFGKVTDLLVSLLAAKTDRRQKPTTALKTPLFFSCFSPSTMIQEKAWYKLSGAQVASAACEASSSSDSAPTTCGDGNCRFSEWCSAHLFVLPAIAKGFTLLVFHLHWRICQPGVKQTAVSSILS